MSTAQQWSAEETNALLAIWSTREIQEKLEGSIRKKRVYEEIAGEMKIAGFNRSADQVINKLKKLKKEYRDQKREMGKSGSGRSKMCHFDVIDSILGHRPASQPNGALNSATLLLESMCASPSSATADAESCTNQEDDDNLDEAETSTCSTASSHTQRSKRSEKRKRNSNQDLLEYFQAADESFMQQTREMHQDILKQMNDTSTSLLGLLGRMVTVMESEQRK